MMQSIIYLDKKDLAFKKVFKKESKGKFYGTPTHCVVLLDYLKREGFQTRIVESKRQKSFKVKGKLGDLEVLISVRRKILDEENTIYTMKANQTDGRIDSIIELLNRYDPHQEFDEMFHIEELRRAARTF